MRRGFTLVELVASMVIIATVGTLGATIIYTAMNGFFQASTRAQLQCELATALDRIAQELHDIPNDSSASSLAPDIASVSASSISWNTGYALTLSGTNLMFSDNGASSALLLPNVSAFTIQTYDESNTALGASLSGTGCDAIRRIQITITMTQSNISETLRTKIFVRSMMSGSGS